MLGKYMVFFDVESFFTNIPLDESIEFAAVKYILSNHPTIKRTNVDLRKLFYIATFQKYKIYFLPISRHYNVESLARNRN